jgi:hypothetical protein
MDIIAHDDEQVVWSGVDTGEIRAWILRKFRDLDLVQLGRSTGG